MLLQEALKTSPRSQKILLIETPATPLPDEKNELTTFSFAAPVSPSPSKPNAKAKDTSSGDGMETTFGKPANETQTQDRTKKKNSVGPNGSWLFDDHPESSTKDSKQDEKASVGSTGSGRLDDKKEKNGEGKKATSTKNNTDDSRRASLTNVTVSVQQESTSAPKKIEIKENTEGEKEAADGKGSSWLLRNGNNRDDKKNTVVREDENERKTDGKDNDRGKDMSNNNGEIRSDSGTVNHESAKGENTIQEIKGQQNDTAKDGAENGAGKKDEGRNIEMIDEEDENNVDDDEDDDDDDEEEDEGDGNEDDGRVGNTNGARKKKGRRRKRIGSYGKLKWNAASKIDTGSGSYAPKKSGKKIPNFKNDYSHVRSRLSSISEASTVKDKPAENPSTERRRSVSINNKPLPDYSNVRPRLYNGARGYNSDMPSTVSKT